MPAEIAPGTERAQFDVEIDGEVIASRGRTMFHRLWLVAGWPSEDRVVAEIERRLRER